MCLQVKISLLLNIVTSLHTSVSARVEQIRELLELRGSTRGITSAVRLHGIFVSDSSLMNGCRKLLANPRCPKSRSVKLSSSGPPTSSVGKLRERQDDERLEKPVCYSRHFPFPDAPKSSVNAFESATTSRYPPTSSLWFLEPSARQRGTRRSRQLRRAEKHQKQ